MNRTKIRNGTGRASTRLVVRLRKLIAEGRWQKGDYLPAIRELSVAHDLSVDTVCRALKQLEQEGLVAGEPRRGYRVLGAPSGADRNCPLILIMGRDRERWDELEQRLAAAIEAAAERRGRAMVTMAAGAEHIGALAEQLKAIRVWGAAVNAEDRRLLDALAGAGIPSVLVETWEVEGRFDAVVQDGFRGGMKAAAYLAGRGHRRIAWFGPRIAGRHVQIAERFGGAAAGLARAGLSLPDELRIESDSDDVGELTEQAAATLSRPDRPTGVLALYLSRAVAAVRAAERLGLVLGRDVEIVGWVTEEVYEGSYRQMFRNGAAPPTMTWSLAAMAEAAVRRLEERRENHGAPTACIEIPARLRLPEAGA